MTFPVEFPNWIYSVTHIKNYLKNNPEISARASTFGNIYTRRRGLMVVDVICSRQRNYETRVLKELLPDYSSKAKDLSLRSLSKNAPFWLNVMKSEPETMQEIAKKILEYGIKNNIVNEDEICIRWALSDTHWMLLDVNGVGPVLLEYLRMLCGVDTIKIDVNVVKALSKLGIETKNYSTDVIVKICKTLSNDVGCTLVELDQILFAIGRSQ